MAGRPERPRRDRRVHRRRAMSRCQRKMVPGVAISRIAARRSIGSVPASRASHARSGHVNANGLAAAHAGRQRADGAASRSRRPSTTTPGATTRAATRHGRRSGRSASSPQPEDHPTSGRTKTCPPGTALRAEPPSAQAAQVFGTHTDGCARVTGHRDVQVRAGNPPRAGRQPSGACRGAASPGCALDRIRNHGAPDCEDAAKRARCRLH